MALMAPHSLPFQLAPYLTQIKNWPATGRHILANFDQHSIIVYQAFNHRIADASVQAQNFHDEAVKKAGYSSARMSWIKTNFLWMMYRSGWATKPSQERILAIRITRVGFEQILLEAKTQGEGTVRLQWDPDHTPQGGKNEAGRKAIQLGLRGDMLDRFSREFVVGIFDISAFVKKQHENVSETNNDLMCPVENQYSCLDEAAAKNVGVS